MGTSEYSIPQYADDPTLTLQDKNSIEKCTRVLHNFSEVSGLKLLVSQTRQGGLCI